MKKQIPQFKNEKEEALFWDNANLAEYFEPSDFKPLKKSAFSRNYTKPITIRLPIWLIDGVKQMASSLDMRYQTLMKQYLEESLERDRMQLLRGTQRFSLDNSYFAGSAGALRISNFEETAAAENIPEIPMKTRIWAQTNIGANNNTLMHYTR